MAEETTEWCLGLPLVQQRKFEEHERQTLQRQVTRLYGWGIGTFLLFPVLVAAVAIAAWTTATSTLEAQVALTVGGVLLVVVYLPLQLLFARDVFYRRKALLLDLSAQGIKQFTGVFTPHIGAEELIRKIGRSRFAPDKTTKAWSVEVLAASGRVWRVQGQAVKPWIVVPIVDVAQTPEIASIAAQWLQPIHRKDKETLWHGRRELSLAEQEELRTHTRRFGLRPLLYAIGFTCWLGVLLTGVISDHQSPNTEDWIHLIFVACVALANAACLAFSLRLSHRMRQDIRSGSVVIVRVKKASPKDSEAMDVVEVLPHAQREWTREGLPAAWRMIHP